jgi:hypothetical protein
MTGAEEVALVVLAIDTGVIVVLLLLGGTAMTSGGEAGTTIAILLVTVDVIVMYVVTGKFWHMWSILCGDGKVNIW